MDEAYLKCKTLQDANGKLQGTLSESQDELERLVKQFEITNQALAVTERELSAIRKQNIELRRDLEDRTAAVNELKEREASRERELQELYAQVIQKDSLMNDCERRLVRQLKDKEQELILIHKKMETTESEKREWVSKIEFLERVNEDKT